jgi:1,4-alpha-glucan branching enzyme
VKALTNPAMSSLGPPKRLIPKKTLRAMNFICLAPQAQAVSLVGDFNEWNPAAHPMKRMPDRAWFVTVELNHGHHRYAFLVDGTLTLDPRAQGITHNDKGERVSLVPVS